METNIHLILIRIDISNTIGLIKYQYASSKHGTTENILTAKNLLNTDPELIVQLYQAMIERFGKDNVDVINAIVNMNYSIIDMNASEYLDERRRIALEKLNEDDIDALQIKHIAAYNKLKYHNVAKELDDIPF